MSRGIVADGGQTATGDDFAGNLKYGNLGFSTIRDMVSKKAWTKPILWAAMMVILSSRAAIAQSTSPSTQATPLATAPSTPQTPLEILQNGPSQEARDVSARNLIASREPASVPDLVQILKNNTNRGGQLAIARALAAIPWPQPDFINPLFAMLEGAPSRVAAAAEALAQYQGNTDVLQRLTRIADSSGLALVRVPVIHAIGRFGQKPAAQTLIDLQQRSSDDAIVRAASDALREMTGWDEPGYDVVQWRAWWDRIGKASDREFHDELARTRADNYERIIGRQRQMEEGVAGLLQDIYSQAKTPEERLGILMRCMQSPIASIRAVGANQVADSRATLEGAPKEAMHEVRTLLSDVAPEVRIAAAVALYNDQDPASASAMVEQLGKETDALAKANLIRSLAPLRDRKALDLAVRFVQTDASPHVQAEAIDAIRLAADVVSNDADLRNRVLATLVPLAKNPAPPGRELLRVKAIDALAAMREASLRTLFQDLVKPAETTDVRIAGLRALGNLKDPNLGDQIAGSMTDVNPAIREAAVQAMGSVVHPLYIPLMQDRLNDANDGVKTAAWEVLKTWMPDLTESDLASLADGLKAAGDQPKQLTALLELHDRLAKDVSSASSDAQRDQKLRDLATEQQNIGDVLQAVGRPGDAAEQFKASLDYWKTHNAPAGLIDTLTGNVASALFAARRWADATAFAEGFVGQSVPTSIEETVSKEFKVAADNLLKSNDPKAYDDAMELFKAIDKMNPKLRQIPYLDQLQGVRQEIQQKHAGTIPP